MRKIGNRDVTTKVISNVIGRRLGFQPSVVLEILLEEESLIKQLVLDGKKVCLSDFLTFERYETANGNARCRVSVSRVWRDDLKLTAEERKNSDESREMHESHSKNPLDDGGG